MASLTGAFIGATKHFLATKGKGHHVGAYKQWSWCGLSLNPHYEANDLSEMIEDDMLIRTTADNWFFGPKDDGDLRSRELMEGLKDKVTKMGSPVMLVTADGGTALTLTAQPSTTT
jgi:hypothetical protein